MRAWLSMCWLSGVFAGGVVACGDSSATGGTGGALASTGSTGATKSTSSATGSGSGASTSATTGTNATVTSGNSTSTGSAMGTPHLGAHGLSFIRYGEGNATIIDAPALATQPSGSTLVASAGRGDITAFALPTDNKGNQPYTQLGTAHPYTLWGGSGTAVYAFPGIAGGADHVVSTTNALGDEVTFAVVEVVGGTTVQEFAWVERLEGEAITSLPVTTTGPATLVAFWWGDAGVDGEKIATPNNGFTVIDSIGEAGALVQCFVAARDVTDAGTYDVTWDATPSQGAQLWLVAVQ